MVEEEDDSAAQEAESILSTLPQNEDDADSRVKTPEWMCKYLRKLPAVGMKQARNEHVMSVIRVLKNVSIPDPNRLLVSTHFVVCFQKGDRGRHFYLGPVVIGSTILSLHIYLLSYTMKTLTTTLCNWHSSPVTCSDSGSHQCRRLFPSGDGGS